MLAYYSVAAREAFWTEHWGAHSVEELLAVARRSPLTTLITQALPAQGVILEAGCGLGQYVLLLRERGWRAAGVDWSLEALSACHILERQNDPRVVKGRTSSRRRADWAKQQDHMSSDDQLPDRLKMHLEADSDHSAMIWNVRLPCSRTWRRCTR